jgi:hypothetical protein
MIDRKGRYLHYHGLSMWPCFQDNDLLEIAPISMEEVRVGDCLVYRGADSQQVVHRVIDKQENLTTRGDAMAHADEHPVLPHQIIGRVVSRHRLGRKIPVANSVAGRLAGRFFHLAGRIDPQRRSRGGRLARGVQRLCSIGLKPLWSRGRTRTLQRTGEAPVVVWGWGQVVIGRQDPKDGEWAFSWPWRVFVKAPEGVKQEG